MSAFGVFLIQKGLGFLLEAPVEISSPLRSFPSQTIGAIPFRMDPSFVRPDGYVPHLLRAAAND